MRVSSRENLTVSRGTAFALLWGNKTGIVTAWHVVRSSNKIITVSGNGLTLDIGPFIQVKGLDVAWFETRIPSQWSILHASPYIIDDEALTAWGYPYTDKELTMYEGSFKGNSSLRHAMMTEAIIVDGVAIPGMSGGPVTNADGDVAAVISTTFWPKHHRHFPIRLPVSPP